MFPSAAATLLFMTWDSGKRIFRLPFRSEMQVCRPVFSPNGTYLAVGVEVLAKSGKKPIVQVWDWRRGKRLHNFERHSKMIDRVLFSPDARLLISLSQDRKFVWTISSGTVVYEFPDNLPVDDVAFGPAGRRLYVLRPGKGQAGQLDIYDTTNWKKIGAMHLVKARYVLEVSPDGRFFRSLGANKTPAGRIATSYFYDCKTGKQLASLPSVEECVFSADGKHLFGKVGQSIRCWSTTTWKPSSRFREHSEPIQRVVWSRNGQMVLTFGENIRCWDSTTGRERWDNPCRLTGSLYAEQRCSFCFHSEQNR
ncbi:MAG: hypothetical protein KatS3mg105_2607 [Gemmatales bacterium]|nr:MAG: hypothetical protein KatS3mg105_2607 [Gemmatales bacterium]